MSEENEHVRRIADVAARMMTDRSEPFEAGFGDIAKEMAALVHSTAVMLDKTQHRVRILNIWLVILTAALVAMPFIERFLLRHGP